MVNVPLLLSCILDIPFPALSAFFAFKAYGTDKNLDVPEIL